MNRNKDPVFQHLVDHNRTEAMRVITDISRGYVNAIDLEKLTTFVQYSLALMQLEGPKKWALAKVNAEIMSINRGQCEDRE